MLLWFGLSWGAMGGLVAQQERGEELFSREPYVQLARTDGVALIWRTTREMDPVVRFGTAFDRLDHQVDRSIVIKRVAATREELRQPSRFLHSAPRGTRQFEATLAGLEPGTLYYYAIYDGADRLTPINPTYRFRTTPLAADPAEAHFWVVGDSGTGGARQSEVHAAMLAYTKRVGQPIDFMLHVGDMAYEEGTDTQFQEHFFDMYAPTLRNTVVWPALGNHEGRSARSRWGVGPYFDAYVCPTKGEAGGVASGNESYYSFDHGPIHFVVLNSFDVDRMGDGAMASWLREDLSQANADWLVAYWHHPPYSKGTHDTDVEKDSIEMRSQMLPILESHGVDLVLTGHSHIYERSMLMDGAYETPTTVEQVILDDGDGDPQGEGPYRKPPQLVPHQGTVQVVTGNGGTDLGRMGTMPVMKRVVVEHGSVLISIRESVLQGVMISFDGEVRDRFQLEKRSGVVSQRLSAPRTLPPYARRGRAGPSSHVTLLEEGSEWAYFCSDVAPPAEWAKPGFATERWSRGKGSFGYRTEDATPLPRAGGSRLRLYARSTFTLPERSAKDQLGLAIRYDDGFIVYINGHEVRRHGVGKGQALEARELATHDWQEELEFFSLERAERYLKEGENVLGIEVHSVEVENEDFGLEARLVEVLKSEEADGEAPPHMTASLLPLGAEWRYSLEQAFEPDWTAPAFEASEWKQGATPVGYGRNLPFGTPLEGMANAFTRVRLRGDFTLARVEDMDTLGLQITWDDGFIAYVNGREIGRGGVARGSGASVLGVGKTGWPATRYFPFHAFKAHLQLGRNVIAIEGHNQALDSSDYFLGPSIERRWVPNWEALPEDYDALVERQAVWEVCSGREPEAGWNMGQGGEAWKEAALPMGYGYRGLKTRLEDMRGQYQTLYLRKQLKLAHQAERFDLGLIAAWDDAMIVFVNGAEAIRVGLPKGSGREPQEVYRVGQAKAGFFPIPASFWRSGSNHVAIEVHNDALMGSDVLIDAEIVRVKPSTAPQPLPESVVPVIPQGAEWRYLAGERPAASWPSLAFDAAGWATGGAGFGYGDGDDATELRMKDRFTQLYLRREFHLDDRSDVDQLGLGIRWDDGFVAYLNGHEILRQNVAQDENGRNRAKQSMEAKQDFTAFPLGPFARWFEEGRNVIAIEGHNARLGSSDFTLDPFVFRADWGSESR